MLPYFASANKTDGGNTNAICFSNSSTCMPISKMLFNFFNPIFSEYGTATLRTYYAIVSAFSHFIFYVSCIVSYPQMSRITADSVITSMENMFRGRIYSIMYHIRKSVSFVSLMTKCHSSVPFVIRFHYPKPASVCFINSRPKQINYVFSKLSKIERLRVYHGKNSNTWGTQSQEVSA